MCPAPRDPDFAGKGPAAPDAAGGDLRALAHYRILRPIGSGGMSEVYLAYDPKSARQVAIKVLADHLGGNHTFVNRFLREGRLGRELTHPNLVKGFVAAQDPSSKRYFIVMEYIDGPTAQERLEREGRLPVAEAVRLTTDIARALEYLHHKRYVHRDIKPGNILIAPDGTAKLADLGVAKELDGAEALTSLEHGVGTPYYMPWEQGVNAGLVDARSDVFALGATFYHLLTGHVPFPGEDETVIAKLKARGQYVAARERLPRLPEALDLILARMLARDPRKRFASALEVVEVLAASGLAEGIPPTEFDLSPATDTPLAPTRADLRPSAAEADTPLEGHDEQLWTVKFRRPSDGEARKFRGPTSLVIRLYEDGALPDDAIAAREPSKVFRRLRAYPAFRRLERRTPAEGQRPDPTRETGALPRGGRSHRLWCGLFLAGLLALAAFGGTAAALVHLAMCH
jgi:serine/threonine protein kinase